jgi:hypothetical protein
LQQAFIIMVGVVTIDTGKSRAGDVRTMPALQPPQSGRRNVDAPK